MPTDRLAPAMWQWFGLEWTGLIVIVLGVWAFLVVAAVVVAVVALVVVDDLV